MADYEWLASESAPAGFPMKVLSGGFTDPAGGFKYVPPNKVIHHGWGTPVSTHLVGEDMAPLPNRLEIEFFSYAEDASYAGSFELPVEAIEALFEAGYHSRRLGEHTTYERLTVGIAPGGHVTVWAVGVDRTAEVWSGCAPEVEVDFERVAGKMLTPREEYVRGQLQRRLSESQRSTLDHDGVPIGRWEQFRLRYPWSLAFDGFRPGVVGPLELFNGEQEIVEWRSEGGVWFRPVPRALELRVELGGRRSLRYLLRFDRAEIFSAFTQLAVADKPMELSIGIAGALSVCLRNPDERLALDHTQLQRFLGR
ncbi:MAG: DUF2931 family protein [Myxococcota bacterium]